MFAELFNAIKAQLESKVTIQLEEASTVFSDIWNSQADNMENQKLYSFPTPAIFIEFLNLEDIQDLGKGLQIYNDMTVRVHIIHRQEDTGDGNQDQNIDVYTFKQAVFAALDKFEPTGAVMFSRKGEFQDTDHTNIYHFIQDYKTNYVDSSRKTPIDGVTKAAPTDLELTKTIVDEIS